VNRRGSGQIRLVVFDWAGTSVDHGCFAPIRPFVETFATLGIRLSADEARGPMGLHKKDHLRALLAIPEITERFTGAMGRAPTEADVERLYEREFVPRQMEALRGAGRPIDGVVEAVAWLRKRGIRIGSSTGYFRDALEAVAAEAARAGYSPDFAFCPGDVPAARPAPWMIFRNMEAAGVFPPRDVLKVGDTLPDIEEGLNAGVWTAAVARTGSEVGLSAPELEALPDAERAKRISRARERLAGGGAHFVIDSVAELPGLVREIDTRLSRGEVP
jgi:phosphonoacetaldehyde hydrolase